MKTYFILFIAIHTAIFSFATTTPTLVSPSNGATNTNVYLYLDWAHVSGNHGYIYQLDISPSFNSPLAVNGSLPQNTSGTYVNSLYFGQTYYWRAATIGASDTSNWSSTRHFTTTNTVNNTSPSNGSQYRSTYLTLDWSAVDGNTGYIYQYDTVSTFNSPAFVQGNSSTNSSNISINNLRYGTTYYWRAAVKNSVDTSDWGPTWHFTTTDHVNNTSPSNGSQYRSTYLTLDWSAVNGNSGYIYQYDTVSTFNSPAFVQGNSSTNSSNISINNLRYGTTYYWRAAVKNNVDTSGWGPTWHFTTFSTLTNYSPSNNSTNKPLNLTIDWNYYSGNTGYLYQVDINPNFNSTQLLSGNTTSSSQKYISNLLYGTTYYWRVAAYNAVDTSDWNSTWNFTTLYQMTTAPTLISPINNTANLPLSNIVLSWNSVLTASSYEVEYSTNSSFSSSVYSVTTSSTNATIGGLSYNVTYYWRVRAVNGSGNSPWSSAWSFTTQVGCMVNASFSTPSNIYCQGDTANISNQTTGATSYLWYLNNVNVSSVSNPLIVFNNAGYTTIKLVAADGNCSDSTSVFFVVNSNYSIYDTISVCKGESYTFPDGIVQSNVISSTNHISNLSTQSGCDSIIYTNLTVTSVDTSVYISGNILIANANNASYQWIDCQNNTSINGQTLKTFTPTITGNYAVEVTQNSCKDTSNCHNILLDGINNFNALDGFVMFPNPTKSFTNISFDILQPEVHIIISSMEGKEIQQYSFFNSMSIKLNTKTLSSGLYLVHIISGNKVGVKKLIISQ